MGNVDGKDQWSACLPSFKAATVINKHLGSLLLLPSQAALSGPYDSCIERHSCVVIWFEIQLHDQKLVLPARQDQEPT